VDEAVELAKKYSTAESGRFVNGVLGNVIRNLTDEQSQP
jgi:putative cofactor-binding repeat protein